MPDDNRLLKKLEALYKLAILRPEEEGNEGRVNEARTSAFLLIKMARENGVKVSFRVPKPEPGVHRDTVSSYPRRPRGVGDPGVTTGGPYHGFDDFFRRAGFAGASASIFEDLFREAAADYGGVDPGKPDSEFRRSQRPTSAPSSRHRTVAPPLITSRYEGTCRTCRKKYGQGVRVYWIEGFGCSHEACGFEELLKQSAAG